MTMKNMTKAVVALAALVPALNVGAALDPAGAPGVTYTDSYAFPAPPNGVNLPWNVVLDIPKFNPALGTLQKVHWEIIGNVEGDYLISNDNPTETGTLNYIANATLAAVGPGLAVNSTPSSAGVFPGIAPNGIVTSDYSGSDTDSGVIVNALDLASWTGVGNVNISVAGTFLGLVGGDISPVNGGVTGAGGVQANVYYEYSDAVVPEPGTYVGGLALLGVGALAYRRMRRA
jgi:hypothetical protein